MPPPPKILDTAPKTIMPEYLPKDTSRHRHMPVPCMPRVPSVPMPMLPLRHPILPGILNLTLTLGTIPPSLLASKTIIKLDLSRNYMSGVLDIPEAHIPSCGPYTLMRHP